MRILNFSPIKRQRFESTKGQSPLRTQVGCRPMAADGTAILEFWVGSASCQGTFKYRPNFGCAFKTVRNKIRTICTKEEK